MTILLITATTVIVVVTIHIVVATKLKFSPSSPKQTFRYGGKVIFPTAMITVLYFKAILYSGVQDSYEITYFAYKIIVGDDKEQNKNICTCICVRSISGE